MERQRDSRELMYCHECENEWYKDESGLSCPRCHSDFTEIMEDPPPDLQNRRPPIPSSFYNRSSPSTSFAPDPDEQDIDGIDPNSPYGSRLRSPPGNMMGHTFQNMIRNMMGPINFQEQFGGPPGNSRSYPGSPASPNSPHSPHTPHHPGFHPAGVQPGNPFQPPTQTFASVANPSARRSGQGSSSNISFSFHSTTYGPDGPRTYHYSSGNRGPGQQEGGFPDLGMLLGNAFGGPSPRQGSMGLIEFLNNAMNAANMRHGDAVFTQEAFDRVLTQLMDEHQSGAAPGPATQAAIAALPKRPATAKELGESGEADCSICMDTVTSGVEISILPCNHWFHPECVKSWLDQHDTCPVCRAGITPAEGSQDQVRTPNQRPLHDESPAHYTQRRESGSAEHPFIIPESPTSDRRRRPSGARRVSRGSTGSRGSSTGGGGESSGVGARLRSWFSNSRGDGTNR